MTAQEKYIFLIVAFCQEFPSCRTLRIFSFLPMVTPFIGTESSAALQNLSYQEGEFDENWNGADVKWALGALIATYLVDAPFNIIMVRLSEILGEKHDREFEEEIYNLIGLDLTTQTRHRAHTPSIAFRLGRG